MRRQRLSRRVVNRRLDPNLLSPNQTRRTTTHEHGETTMRLPICVLALFLTPLSRHGRTLFRIPGIAQSGSPSSAPSRPPPIWSGPCLSSRCRATIPMTGRQSGAAFSSAGHRRRGPRLSGDLHHVVETAAKLNKASIRESIPRLDSIGLDAAFCMLTPRRYCCDKPGSWAGENAEVENLPIPLAIFDDGSALVEGKGVLIAGIRSPWGPRMTATIPSSVSA